MHRTRSLPPGMLPSREGDRLGYRVRSMAEDIELCLGDLLFNLHCGEWMGIFQQTGELLKMQWADGREIQPVLG